MTKQPGMSLLRKTVPLSILGILLFFTPCTIVRASEQSDSPVFLASEGGGAFRAGGVDVCDAPLLVRAEPPYFRAMDRAADGDIYGLSDDQLYRLNLATGAFEPVGPITFAAGARFWFTTGAETEIPFVFAAPGATGPMTWYLRITVGVVGAELEETEYVAEYSGILADGSPGQVLIDDCVAGPGCFDALETQAVMLSLVVEDDGLAWLHLSETGGINATTSSGVFVVLTPNAVDASPLRLPGAGLTVQPDGTVWMLSDAEWDPFGEAALYELDLGGPDVNAQYVSTPDVAEVNAIEFLDNGQLYGAGEAIYLIDPLMGAAVPVGDLAGNAAVEMAADDQGELHVLTRGTEGQTQVQASPSGETELRLEANPYWGLETFGDDPADLDGNGVVDAADQALFDASFTGSLGGPYVPPGKPVLLPAEIVVPSLGPFGSAKPCLFGFEAAGCDGVVYWLDVFNDTTAGNLVEGPVAMPEDSSAWITLSHWNGVLHVGVQVYDDARVSGGADLGDQVELYFDPNNSRSPMREGNSNGFRAVAQLDGSMAGDPAALPFWSFEPGGYYRPGYRAEFAVDVADLGLEPGDSTGFDLAIRDVDPDEPDGVRYFQFATGVEGEHDERQWGHLRLATGPLAPPAFAPIPTHGAEHVDVAVTLAWTPGTNGLVYYVYLGAHPDELVFQDVTTASTVSVGLLSPASSYFWRVDEMNLNGVRRGTTWRFTTAANPADSNWDGDVDDHDYRRLFQRPLGDLDADQLVNATDYALMNAALGSTVGDPHYDPGGDYDSDDAVTEADLHTWLCYVAEQGLAVEGDLDGDGDVDRDDLEIFTTCMAGPVVEAEPACWLADFSGDFRVDFADASLFLPLVEPVMP